LYDILRQWSATLVAAWGLNPADVHRLAQRVRFQTYSAGQPILPHGVQADFLASVVSGQVGAYSGQQPSARRVAILQPGSSFGEIMPAKALPADTALLALSACEIMALHRADLEALVGERQAAQRRRRRMRRTLSGALALLLVLGLALALSQPVFRQAGAVVPLALGQWCSEQEGVPAYDACTGWASTLAATLAPADAAPQLALGMLHARRGEWAAAERSFEAARALAPDWAEIYNNLGVVYAQQGDPTRAIEAFEQALLLEPGTATVERNLGLSLQALQAYDEALTHYELALAFGEPVSSTLLNMALAYYETGQLDRAAETARRLLDDEEASAPAYMVLGAVALRGGAAETAVANLERAIALDPGSREGWYYLGLAYRQLNRPAEAAAALEQALVSVDDQAVRVEIRRYLQELYAMQP